MIPRLLIVISLIALAACTPPVERCTADPNLPDCQAARAVAKSTIAAANADTDARVRQAQMQATQDAVALHAQATQGAINTRATAEVVAASATRVALENTALRESLALTATLQAAQFTIITTKTALEGEAKVRAATVEADTAGLRQWLLVGTFVVVMVVVAFTTTRTATRTTERVGEALSRKAENQAALVYYGPNNSHAGLLDRGPNGELIFKPIDQALAALDYWLPRLAVPDQLKLQAIADYSKRSAVIDGVSLTGVWPLIDEPADEPLPQIALPPSPYPYTLVTQAATSQPLAAWLDEVELKLLAHAAGTGGQA